MLSLSELLRPILHYSDSLHRPDLVPDVSLANMSGNDAHYGYPCPSFVPDPCYNRNFDCFPHDSQTLPQQYQTPPVASMEMLHAQTDLIEAMQDFLKKYDHIPHNEKDLLILLRFSSEIIEVWVDDDDTDDDDDFDDDDDSIPLGDIIARSKAITPDLLIEEPDNFLSMGDEHLDTIPSVEYLVPIPRESEGLSDNGSECDDESLSEEEIQKDEFNSFSNPLYDIDDEIITNESNLLSKWS
ncbi:hypothetical protein Tco_0403913 [Tanacetum coccineum]